MLTKLSHIGLLVKNLDETADTYGKLFGLKPSSPTINLPYGGMKAQIFPLGDNCSLVISEPTDPSANASRVLEKRGQGIFLIATEVDDLDKQIKSLKDNDIEVTEGTLGPGLPNVGWIHPRYTSGILIELIPQGFLKKMSRLAKK